jgi:hypothetical protein
MTARCDVGFPIERPASGRHFTRIVAMRRTSGLRGWEKSMSMNTTGFSDATYSAVCAVLGVDDSAPNLGLNHALGKIERELRGTRFTIGDIAARYARSVLKIVESAARMEQLNENA